MADLSRKSGVSKKIISEFEHGQKTYFAKMEHKFAIANAFGLSVEEFDQIIGGA